MADIIPGTQEITPIQPQREGPKPPQPLNAPVITTPPGMVEAPVVPPSGGLSNLDAVAQKPSGEMPEYSRPVSTQVTSGSQAATAVGSAESAPSSPAAANPSRLTITESGFGLPPTSSVSSVAGETPKRAPVWSLDFWRSFRKRGH